MLQTIEPGSRPQIVVEKTRDLQDVMYRLFSGMSAEIAGKRLINLPSMGQETVHLHERQFAGY
jgi:hypothetical protein